MLPNHRCLPSDDSSNIYHILCFVKTFFNFFRSQSTTARREEPTTKIVYEDGVKYSVDENGIRWVIPEGYQGVTENRDANKCPYCGKTTCCPFSYDYFCVICKKTIPKNTCHPEDHLLKSR